MSKSYTVNREGKIDVIFGGQYGSEGKGAIVNIIANNYNVHVRVGGPNAGHTVYHEGIEYKMQCIPCGWINPKAQLVLGRGMLINPEILLRELLMIEKIDPSIWERLVVDELAGILHPRFHKEEGGTKGTAHERIGSTGEGVGLAREARMSRGRISFELVKDVTDEFPFLNRITSKNTTLLMSNLLAMGQDVLLEGTQGFGLSLIHGQWPYVTSTDTGPAQMLADAGLPVGLVRDVIMVIRTFPIRVAGNSGPLKNEISWQQLSEKLETSIIERTTVTKLIRRVGMFDWDMVDEAVRINRPTKIAMTFLDYLNKNDSKVDNWNDLSLNSTNFITDVTNRYGIDIIWAKTGPYTEDVVMVKEDTDGNPRN